MTHLWKTFQRSAETGRVPPNLKHRSRYQKFCQGHHPHRNLRFQVQRGESLLGLACRVGHDSEDGADAAAGDEHAQTPAEKQLRAVRGVLAWTLALDKRASSVNAQAQGLPSEATLLREVRERGAAESYVFRAAVRAPAAPPARRTPCPSGQARARRAGRAREGPGAGRA